MLTRLDEETLLRYGARYRTGYLLEQARYTCALASSETGGLLLPDGYLARVEEAILRVEAMRDDREAISVASKMATSKQNAAFEEAKLWRRKVASRTQRAARMGVRLPSELLVIRRATTVPAILEYVGLTLRLLRANAELLRSVGDVKPFIEEGQKIHDLLASADATQEMKRLAELPAAVRCLWRSKGELYVALKVINDAGRELHQSDPERASRYHLRILHRRGAKYGEPDTPEAPSEGGSTT